MEQFVGNRRGKIGLMVVGHKECRLRLAGSCESIPDHATGFERFLRTTGVVVVAYTAADGTPMCNSPEESYQAGLLFKTEDVDLVFLVMTENVESGRYMLGVLACEAPVVAIAYQQFRHMRDVWVGDDIYSGGTCPLPEACNTMKRCLKPPVGVLYGAYYGDGIFAPRFEREVKEWCRVADALRAYKGAIFGQLGHAHEGMLDLNYDPTSFTHSFGIHIRMLEMCQLAELVREASPDDISEKLNSLYNTFDIVKNSETHFVKPEDVEWIARCSVGLDELISKYNLSGIVYYYEGRNDNEYQHIMTGLNIGRYLLVPGGCSLAAESDMRTCLAMYTASALGVGGSIAELCIAALEDDVILIGNANLLFRNLGMSFKKRGNDVSVGSSLKTDQITMFSVGMDEDNRCSFLVAEGEANKEQVSPRGGTFASSCFGGDVSTFAEEWSNAGNSHRHVLSVGHHASVLEKLARALGVGFRQIR